MCRYWRFRFTSQIVHSKNKKYSEKNLFHFTNRDLAWMFYDSIRRQVALEWLPKHEVVWIPLGRTDVVRRNWGFGKKKHLKTPSCKLYREFFRWPVFETLSRLRPHRIKRYWRVERLFKSFPEYTMKSRHLSPLCSLNLCLLYPCF